MTVALLPQWFDVLDRMIRADVCLDWQRGNGSRAYTEHLWWRHGVYSGYQIPDTLDVRALLELDLIYVDWIGEPPANVWHLRPTAAGEAAWSAAQAGGV